MKLPISGSLLHDILGLLLISVMCLSALGEEKKKRRKETDTKNQKGDGSSPKTK